MPLHKPRYSNISCFFYENYFFKNGGNRCKLTFGGRRIGRRKMRRRMRKEGWGRKRMAARRMGEGRWGEGRWRKQIIWINSQKRNWIRNLNVSKISHNLRERMKYFKCCLPPIYEKKVFKVLGRKVKSLSPPDWLKRRLKGYCKKFAIPSWGERMQFKIYKLKKRGKGGL